MKKALLALISTFLISTNVSANNINVVVDGKNVTFDEPPLVENGTTYVPIRAILENVNNYMTWDESVGEKSNQSKKVTMVWDSGNRTVNYNSSYKDSFVHSTMINVDNGNILTRFNMLPNNLESYSFTLNNKLELEPKVINGRTLLPMRAVAETYGYEVSWDNNTKTAYINSNNPVITNDKGETINIYELLNGDSISTNNNDSTVITDNTSSNTLTIEQAIEEDRLNEYYVQHAKEKNYLTEQEKIDIANEMLSYVNELREDNGLNPLELDQDLIDFAYLKAEDFKYGGYSNDAVTSTGTGYHVSPRYGSPSEWYNSIHNTNYFLYENLALTSTKKEYVATSSFTNWINSKGHKDAMLNSKIVKLGFGFYTIEDEIHEDFGRTIMLLEMR